MVFAQVWFSCLSASVANRLASARSRAHTGQGLVEYALIVGVIAVAGIVVMGMLSGKIGGIFNAVGTQLQGVPAAPTPTP